MNVKPIIAPLAVALVTAGAITASAAGAFAATPSPTASAQSTTSSNRSHLGKDATLQQIQAAATSATGQRITKLNAAITQVNADKTLTSSDRSMLLSTLQGDLSGMQQLQAKIAADTTASQARTDYTTIFRQYRVLAVALPQERIVREADRATATALPRLQAAEQRLSNQLEKQQARTPRPRRPHWQIWSSRPLPCSPTRRVSTPPGWPSRPHDSTSLTPRSPTSRARAKHCAPRKRPPRRTSRSSVKHSTAENPVEEVDTPHRGADLLDTIAVVPGDRTRHGLRHRVGSRRGSATPRLTRTGRLPASVHQLDIGGANHVARKRGLSPRFAQ